METKTARHGSRMSGNQIISCDYSLLQPALFHSKTAISFNSIWSTYFNERDCKAVVAQQCQLSHKQKPDADFRLAGQSVAFCRM